MSLSTHVLDTAHGVPAAGMALVLRRGDITLLEAETDAGGRCPALGDLAIGIGRYSLAFAVADYFRNRAVVLPDPPFLDTVTIAFGVAEGGAHYHVPLLVSPFAYSTYRGS